MASSRYRHTIAGIIMVGILMAGLVAACGSYFASMGTMAGLNVKQHSVRVAGVAHDECCVTGNSGHYPLSKMFSNASASGLFASQIFMVLFFPVVLLLSLVLFLGFRQNISQYYYYLKRFLFKAMDYLSLAFSQGLLNPKLYTV